MKKTYVITVEGCDDSTRIEYALTETQAKLLKDIAEKITKASTYTCMPCMDVEEKTKER